jgi:RNA polymerase sigma-70 factor, ECF subfamily
VASKTPLADRVWERAKRVDSDPDRIDREALEHALVSALGRARSASPGIDVSDEAFATHLAERLSPGRPVIDALSDLRVEDLYLACACANGSEAAVALVEKRCLDKAKAALSRLAPGDDALQHVRQVLFVGTGVRGPRIAEYGGRGDLAKWIRTIAMRVAFDMLAPKPEVALEAEKMEDFGLPIASHDLELMKRQYGAAFKTALADAVRALPAETRVALRAYYLEGRGLEEMAADEGVAASTISRRLSKARETLWLSTRQALLTRLAVSEPDLDSILRLLQTRLELSRSALEASDE